MSFDGRGLGCPLSSLRPERVVFEHGSSLFLSAVAHGVRFDAAIDGFGVLGNGTYSHDDHFYECEASMLHRADRLAIPGAAGQPDVTIFMFNGIIAARTCTDGEGSAVRGSRP